TRECGQVELASFCRPEGGPRWFDHWQEPRGRWSTDRTRREENLRIRPRDPDELSHYSAAAADLGYASPRAWAELAGTAHRPHADLRAHSEASGEDLRYFDQETNERFCPSVIVPAAGASRTMFAFLIDAYHEEEVNGEQRVVLKLDPRLAPYQVAILPLSKKPELTEPASKIADSLRSEFMLEYDETQSIGRRYRRQD